jgi:hypothetical protein
VYLPAAPGYDDWLPHDLLHFVAEAELGLDGGIFGDLAAGGNARLFWPVDRSQIPKLWRARRIKKQRLTEGRRSEELAAHLDRGWHARTLEPQLLAKLDALAEQWHDLPIGGELTLEWPLPEGVRRRDRHARARPATARRQHLRA